MTTETPIEDLPGFENTFTKLPKIVTSEMVEAFNNDTTTLTVEGGVLDLTTAAQEVKAETNPTPAQPPVMMTRPALLNALRQMWGKGQIEAPQLQQLCMQLRISVSKLLRGTVNAKQKKRIKKLKTLSRRINRHNGCRKGQTKQHYHKSLKKA